MQMLATNLYGMKRSVSAGEKYQNTIDTVSKVKAILGGLYDINVFMTFLLFLFSN